MSSSSIAFNRVIEDALGRPQPDRGWHVRIGHQFEDSEASGTGSLLQARNHLLNCFTARRAIRVPKLGICSQRSSVLGLRLIARAASSTLRCERSAATASSFFCPNFEPCPFICPSRFGRGDRESDQGCVAEAGDSGSIT